MKRFYRFMHWLFWRKLCPRPDGCLNLTFHGWPYNFTGRVASFFHLRLCDRCRERYAK
jgi:hypothetical protein